jgi:Ser/Thr protein kinase RdoA (MazF antagonist)
MPLRRTDDGTPYRRPEVTDEVVTTMLERLGVDGTPPDLGGTMSLNLDVVVEGRRSVLRIHAPFVSRARTAALQRLRSSLAQAGLRVGIAQPIGRAGATLVRVGTSLVEVESFVEHEKPPPTWASYLWMYEAMGRLHRHVSTWTDGSLPRPVVATYGPPSSLRRWLAMTTAAVSTDAQAVALAAEVGELVRRLDRQWVPPSSLPRHVVHGDVRLGNVAVAPAPDGAPVYLDFGFAAVRPRIHELAYSLPWIVVKPDDSGRPEDFDWAAVEELVAAYESGAGTRLSSLERRALGPYVAAVPLYLASVAGFTPDPIRTLVGERPLLRVAEWVLDHGIP